MFNLYIFFSNDKLQLIDAIWVFADSFGVNLGFINLYIYRICKIVWGFAKTFGDAFGITSVYFELANQFEEKVY
jgi:hypothetical protein